MWGGLAGFRYSNIVIRNFSHTGLLNTLLSSIFSLHLNPFLLSYHGFLLSLVWSLISKLCFPLWWQRRPSAAHPPCWKEKPTFPARWKTPRPDSHWAALRQMPTEAVGQGWSPKRKSGCYAVTTERNSGCQADQNNTGGGGGDLADAALYNILCVGVGYEIYTWS